MIFTNSELKLLETLEERTPKTNLGTFSFKEIFTNYIKTKEAE